VSRAIFATLTLGLVAVGCGEFPCADSNTGGDTGGARTCQDGGCQIPPAVADMPPCSSLADCAKYLSPGPCGTLACDESGTLGLPPNPYVPPGCYIRITPACETTSNIGGPCSVDSDCLPIKCYTPTCMDGVCDSPPEPAGTPCDAASVCDGVGHCKPQG
jgi:hypothetical protein